MRILLLNKVNECLLNYCKCMSTGISDVMTVEYWTLNTTNKPMEKCMDVVRINTKYAKTEARNTRNKSVDLTQLSLRR